MAEKTAKLKLHRMTLQDIHRILLTVCDESPRGISYGALLGAASADLAIKVGRRLAEPGMELKLSLSATEVITLYMAVNQYQSSHEIGRHESMELSLITTPLHQLMQ